MRVNAILFMCVLGAIVGITTPAQADPITYWNLFNIEDETAQGSRLVTYASLADMLVDENRLGVFNPDGGFVSQNVVGSGSDGTTYWNVFNIEDETAQGSRIVTYASLADMLADENRLGVFNPDGGFVSQNVVGSGAGILGQAVPEPSSAVLSALAIAGMLVRGRRRRVAARSERS